MAVHKGIRSNPPAQPQPQRPRTDHQRKADIFETLRHLNRGYGISLNALDRLEIRGRLHRPHIFPTGFLEDYRNRTEALRALINWDLLRLVGEHEKQDAERFGRVCGPAESKSKRRS
jgi:hypothetical protein